MKSTTATRPACAGCSHPSSEHSTSVGCLVVIRETAYPGGQPWARYCTCDAYDPSVRAIARARTSDPDTSHAAAASLTPETLRLSQSAVLSVLTEYPGGLTDQGLALVYGSRRPAQSESGLRTRRAELVRGGLVVDTGRRERLASGRMAVVWAVAP